MILHFVLGHTSIFMEISSRSTIVDISQLLTDVFFHRSWNNVRNCYLHGHYDVLTYVSIPNCQYEELPRAA